VITSKIVRFPDVSRVHFRPGERRLTGTFFSKKRDSPSGAKTFPDKVIFYEIFLNLVKDNTVKPDKGTTCADFSASGTAETGELRCKNEQSEVQKT